MCTERAAPENVRVQHVRAGALQIGVSQWIVLHYLCSLRLPLAMSHYSFLLPWEMRHTAACAL